jgi:hypothetical protein
MLTLNQVFQGRQSPAKSTFMARHPTFRKLTTRAIDVTMAPRLLRATQVPSP